MSGLSTLLADLKEQEALDTVKKMLGDGLDPMQILAEAREGMQVVGQRFGCGEYFIPDLIYSGEILKGIAQMVAPYIKSSGTEAKKLGKVIIASVAGDIQDI